MRPRLRAGLAAAFVALALLANAPASAADAPAPAQAELSARAHSLSDILRTLDQLRADRLQRQRELDSETARGREEQIRNEIQQISSAIGQLDDAFTQIASEVDPRSFVREESSEPVELSKELRDLLAPLVSELKSATQRPREIDRLRTEVAEYEAHLVAIARALENLTAIADAADNAPLRAAIAAERSDWETRQQSERTHLAVAQQKLEQQLAARRSVRESFDALFELFFKSRGRNLVIALLATTAFWLLLRRIHLEIRRHGPGAAAAAGFRGRLFDLLYVVVTTLGAFIVFAVVLYFFGDWVLLILFLLLILGLVWASKQAIPKFWSQATLLLNVGPVREGERLVLDGVAYRVDTLGLYSQLANPRLQGALRLPISDLFALRSRPVEEGEPWFPTASGDWVLLADGSFGQITFQSIEHVCLRRAGGSERVYSTAEFPAQLPEVLSSGFLVAVTFGVDYQHQAGVTGELVAKLKRSIDQGLRDAGGDEWLRSLVVEFKQAGASSLDLVVLCEIAGAAAPRRFAIERRIQSLCVDACNENGWVIPFPQMTVHHANAEPSPPSR